MARYNVDTIPIFGGPLAEQQMGNIKLAGQKFPDVLSQLQGNLYPGTAARENMLKKDLYESVIPKLAERFTGLSPSAQRSSGFAQLVGSQAGDLGERIAALRESNQLANNQQVMSLLNMLGNLGQTPTHQNIINKTWGTQLKESLPGLLGQAGNLAAKYFTGGLSPDIGMQTSPGTQTLGSQPSRYSQALGALQESGIPMFPSQGIAARLGGLEPVRSAASDLKDKQSNQLLELLLMMLQNAQGGTQ